MGLNRGANSSKKEGCISQILESENGLICIIAQFFVTWVDADISLLPPAIPNNLKLLLLTDIGLAFISVKGD